MRSLWRRFMAWLNADDVLHDLTSGAIPPAPKFFVTQPDHARHCSLCASAGQKAGARENA